MAIPAEVTLRPSGRTFDTTLPHHPADGRDMIVWDGGSPLRIHVTAWGGAPHEAPRGRMPVEAYES